MSDPFVTPFDQPDPDAVARSERFIDALAKREPVDFVMSPTTAIRDRALAGLLEDWRDELRVAGRRGVCPEQDAVAALNRGLAARRRARRRMALVGAMAAAVLGVAGFGALMGQAQPGGASTVPHDAVRGARVGARRPDRGVRRDRLGPGSANDRAGPMGSGPGQTGSGRRPRADRQRQRSQTGSDRPGEPVERQGRQPRPHATMPPSALPGRSGASATATVAVSRPIR